MQFSKLPCRLHQNELITNFCEEENCLMPLCPSCIPFHLSSHPKTIANPRIQNINNTLNKVVSNLLNIKTQFQHQKDQLKTLIVQHKSIKYRLSEGLNIIKNQTKQLIDRLFLDLEEKYQQQIQQTFGRNNLNEHRLAEFQQEVDEKITELHNKIQHIKNNTNFQVLIDTMNQQKTIILQKQLFLIKEQIQSHRNQHSFVSFSSEEIDCLKNLPNQLMNAMKNYMQRKLQSSNSTHYQNLQQRSVKTVRNSRVENMQERGNNLISNCKSNGSNNNTGSSFCESSDFKRSGSLMSVRYTNQPYVNMCEVKQFGKVLQKCGDGGFRPLGRAVLNGRMDNGIGVFHGNVRNEKAGNKLTVLNCRYI